MAKKKKETTPEVNDIDLLGGNVAEIEVEEPEVVAVINTVKKEKKFLGFHPITKEEVWN